MSYIEIGEKFKNVTRDMRKFERRQKRFSPVRERRDGKKNLFSRELQFLLQVIKLHEIFVECTASN